MKVQTMRGEMNKACNAAAVLLVTVLGGCAAPERVSLPEPVQQPASAARPAGEVLIEAEAARRPERLTQLPTPRPPGADSAASGLTVAENIPPLRNEPVNVNIEGVPVPAFINEFFGTILGTGFQMSPEVARMNDLVTLRTPGPQSPQAFYRLAVEVLQTYGVETRYEGGRLLFLPASKGGTFEPPLVLSGRTLPTVPVSHRPVFQLVELQAVRIPDVVQWLNTAFQTNDLRVIEDLNRNAIVLYGKPDVVRQAVDAIRVLDRPYMRGRTSTRLEPAFVDAQELARRLVDVLVAEGYGASLHTGQGVVQAASVIVLPVASANTVLLFAADPAVLAHAVEWARSIDRPNPTAGGTGLFYYRVQNTRAEDIVQTLNGVREAAAALEVRAPVRDAMSSAEASAAGQVAGAAPAPGPTQAAAGGSLAGGQLVLDAPRNALIFQGSSTDWGRLLPLVQQMDQAPRQVMIEVTIAEVTLDDNEEFGVSWLAKNDVGRFGGRVTSGVIGGAGGSSGLTYLLDVAGQTRAQLRAYAEDNRVTVLSTPRLLVKSGEPASIDVGTEVPTISAQTASLQQTEGTSNILQSVQYRKTGIILNIKPTVYSDNRIDLEIRQEVSEALPLGNDSVVQSPSIFNRAVSTSLSLRDGSSVLIGGLMSRRVTNSDGGVPYLKDIPVLGGLFESNSRRNNKTELVLMIVPYIVETDEEALGLTRSVADRYQMLDVPAAPVLPEPLEPLEPAGTVPGERP